MKVLLDENLDHALRALLGQHDVLTVTYMGWTGLKNASTEGASLYQPRPSAHKR